MKKFAILFAAVFIVSLAAKLPGLGTFMTVDEELWMLRSGEFYHKLLAGDPAGTFITTHPGTTLNWIAGAGIVMREAQLGYNIDTSNIGDFRLYALMPVAVFHSLLLAAAVTALSLLFGLVPAISAGVVVLLDPFLAGLTQIVHVDALLAFTMLNAALWFLVALPNMDGMGMLRRPARMLIAAGIFSGLAFSTKLLPALWLPCSVGALLILHCMKGRIHWHQAVRGFCFMFGIGALVFVMLWPATWAKTDNLDQYIAKDTVTVIQDEHVASEEGADAPGPASFYLRTILGRIPPFVQLVAGGVAVSSVIAAVRIRWVPTSLLLSAYAGGYIFVIANIAKKADRYALPALVVVAVLAGVGAGIVFEKLRHKRGALAVAIGALVVISLIAQLSAWYPYAIAYTNPLFPNIRPLHQQGWGEGLDAAAAWLNGRPFIDRLTIASWYPSVMAHYFHGKTMSLSSREDHRVGYVVLYRNMGGRAQDSIASDVLDEFEDKTPEHVISIRGVPYVWIYNTLGPYYFRQHVGELVRGVEAGQVVPVGQDNWHGIDIAMATFSSRVNTEDVTLEIRGNIDDSAPIRTVTVNAASIRDEEWHRFTFEPIAGSSGKDFYISLSSPASYPGNAVTVRYSNEDVRPGQMVLRREALQGGQKRSQFVKTGDLAYRFP